jgi:hypothetical protein
MHPVTITHDNDKIKFYVNYDVRQVAMRLGRQAVSLYSLLALADCSQIGPNPGKFKMLVSKGRDSDFDNVSHPKEVTVQLAKMIYDCLQLMPKWQAGTNTVVELFGGRGTITASLLNEVAKRGQGTVRAYTDRGQGFNRLVRRRAGANQGRLEVIHELSSTSELRKCAQDCAAICIDIPWDREGDVYNDGISFIAHCHHILKSGCVLAFTAQSGAGFTGLTFGVPTAITLNETLAGRDLVVIADFPYNVAGLIKSRSIKLPGHIVL